MIDIFAKHNGISIIELLLALAILSVSMYPLVYVITIAEPAKLENDDEYIATMLAHHVIETIVARRAKDPSYLPHMSDSRPVVALTGSTQPVNEYFVNLPEYNDAIRETNEPQLYWSFNKFSCQADTYYLDDNIFKIIVYVTYPQEGRTMKVFFERLLPLNNMPDELPEDEQGGNSNE